MCYQGPTYKHRVRILLNRLQRTVRNISNDARLFFLPVGVCEKTCVDWCLVVSNAHTKPSGSEAILKLSRRWWTSMLLKCSLVGYVLQQHTRLETHRFRLRVWLASIYWNITQSNKEALQWRKLSSNQVLHFGGLGAPAMRNRMVEISSPFVCYI